MEIKRCSFENCFRDSYSLGLCKAHYSQKYRKNELKPLRKTRNHPCTTRNDSGQKRCGSCREWKDETEFQIDNRKPDKLQNRCKYCTRSAQLMLKYGMTAREFDHLLMIQNGVCAICKEQSDKMHIDHDHGCCPGEKTCGKCIRMLLCDKCNRGMGYFRENPEFLREAARYVESFRQ